MLQLHFKHNPKVFNPLISTASLNMSAMTTETITVQFGIHSAFVCFDFLLLWLLFEARSVL